MGEDGTLPPLPDHLPQYDDEGPLGVSIFRTVVSDCVLENLTLPRTFFGRSEIVRVSFKNTDLSESNLCWNDFNEVKFDEADLSRSDLRASNYKKVSFARGNLKNADLRHSTFDSCDFADAEMRDAKMTRDQCRDLVFSDNQIAVIDWQESAGEEPPGG